MPRRVLRTREEIDEILANGGLELAEEYDPEKSYGKQYWMLTRCKTCGVEAHYRLEYIINGSGGQEPVCRACFWKQWLEMSGDCSMTDYIDEGIACERCEKAGYELVDFFYKHPRNGSIEIVRCKFCGRQSAIIERDIESGCSCRRHVNTAAHYAPPVTRKVVKSDYVYKPTTVLSIEEAKVTPCSEVPELMEAWDDPRDPRTTMVYPTGWRGMYPGDGQYYFKCKNSHRPGAFPYSYLQAGCPFCRGNATKGTGLYLADQDPEMAAEWCHERNGTWTPENIRVDSKRKLWWHCLACGHEWQDTPRERSKRSGQCCPKCGKIRGSIAWLYPSLAAEWSEENPVSPWMVRPNAQLGFTPLWDCPENKGHHWRALVATRVRGGGCPECVDSGKSRIELKYFDAARKVLAGARSGAKFEDAAFSNPWTIDISGRYAGMRVAMEYDGGYWHKDKVDVDIRKSEELVAAGFKLVRFREEGLPALTVGPQDYAEVVVSKKTKPSDAVSQALALFEGMSNKA